MSAPMAEMVVMGLGAWVLLSATATSLYVVARVRYRRFLGRCVRSPD